MRGLDYYTRTVFEFTSDALGAQSGVGGGGRYDGLIELLGGPPTPAWAGRPGWSGCCWPPTQPVARGAAASTSSSPTRAGGVREAFSVAAEARRAGARRRGAAGRSLKGQLKQADRAAPATLPSWATDGIAAARHGLRRAGGAGGGDGRRRRVCEGGTR